MSKNTKEERNIDNKLLDTTGENDWVEVQPILTPDSVFQDSKNYQKKILNDLSECPHFKIQYKKKTARFRIEEVNQDFDEYILVQAIQVNTMRKTTGASKKCPVKLKTNNGGNFRYYEGFTIGSLQPEIINKGEFDAQIQYNALDFQDEMMGPVHLEVDYTGISNIKTWQDQFNEYNKIFLTSKSPFCSQTQEEICKYIYSNKRKLKVKDISSKRGFTTLIQIKQQCENQILEANKMYRIGYIPQLTVKKVYDNLLAFFKRYAPNIEIIRDAVFEGLQQIRSKVQFSGIDDGLAQLFMLVQDRSVNRAEYNDRLSDQNLMMDMKLETAVYKPCVLLQLLRDENPIEHFMLVADLKETFSFGRMEFSDVNFQSIQVSRNHGTIKYMNDKNQWIIMDGQGDAEGWKPSSFGVWLEMRQHTYYYVDNSQVVKIGQTQVTLEPQNLTIEKKETLQLYDERELMKARQEEQEILIDQILSLG